MNLISTDILFTYLCHFWFVICHISSQFFTCVSSQNFIIYHLFQIQTWWCHWHVYMTSLTLVIILSKKISSIHERNWPTMVYILYCTCFVLYIIFLGYRTVFDRREKERGRCCWCTIRKYQTKKQTKEKRNGTQIKGKYYMLWCQ